MPDARLAECVAKAARSRLPLQDAAFGDEHEYASLPLCVIDAVFSIGVKYASTKLVPPRWAAAQATPWPAGLPPQNGHSQDRRACLKRANKRHRLGTKEAAN
jgi:hypothetical protein